MRKLLLAGAAAISTIVVPAIAMAQSNMGGSTNTVEDKRAMPDMSPEQQAEYDAWPADRQTDYMAWPVEYQVYYWDLQPEQQDGYWAMTDDQRGRIYKMSPEQQQMAWDSVVAQLNGQTPATPMAQANPPGMGMPTTGSPDPKMANQAVQPAMPADESYQGGPYKGAMTPPPATAMNKEYPLCRGEVQDSCINPREAGKNWGNRPLDHWPGKPASEIGG